MKQYDSISMVGRWKDDGESAFEYTERIEMDGGSGSGDWGHKGRPGMVGGSGGGGGKQHRRGSKESGYSSKAKERKQRSNVSGKHGKTVSKVSNKEFCDEAKRVLGEDGFGVLEDELKKYINSVSGDTRKLAGCLDKLDNLKWTSNEPLYRSIGVSNDTAFGKKGLFNELVESYQEGNEFTMQSLSWSSDEDCAMFFGQTKGSHVIMYINETMGGKNAVSVEGWQNDVYGEWYTSHTKEVLSTDLDQIYIPTNVEVKGNTAYVHVVEKVSDRKDENSTTMNGSEYGGIDLQAASVLVIHDGRILCASRSNAEGICGPGGKVEAGETPEEAAVREAQEEFHITPHNLIPLGDYKGSPPLYLPCRMYFTDQYSGIPEADGEEMLDARWMTLQELSKEQLFLPFEESLHRLMGLFGGDGYG